MINYASAQDCLYGVIGFRNNYQFDFDTLDTDLTDSSSGLFIDHTLHPLLTFENISLCAENFGATQVKNWSGTVQYQKDDLAYTAPDVYRSLTNDNLNHDISNATYWQKTNLVSSYLRIKQKGSINNLLSALLTQKKVNEAAKSLLSESMIYDGWGNISDQITKGGRFVFWKVRLLNKGTVIKLRKVGLQFTQANTFNLYIFHTSQLDPIAVIPISQTAQNNFKWYSITEQTLSFLDDSINGGGEYYLGYFENSISGNAIKKEIDFINGGCQSCGNSNYKYYSKWNQYLSIQPGYVGANDLNGTQLWNTQRDIYIDNSSMGMNFQLSVQCEVTNVFCDNKYLLADALRKQMMVDLISEMAYSSRDNQRKEKIGQMAAYTLDNRDNGSKGLKAELADAINAIDLDFSSLEGICLPCVDGKYGVRTSSMY